MKRLGILFFGAVLVLVCFSAAQAQYRPPPRREAPAREEDFFGEAVDLERFRRSNGEWDTQALIASGLAALHQEHQRILKELSEIKTELRNLKEKNR